MTDSVALTAVFASSIVGSLHCVAMCGPLVGLGSARTARLALVHSLGRLVTYAIIGMLAGAIGRAVDVAADLAAIQRAATILAGVAILAWGGVQLATAVGWRRSSSTKLGTAFSSGLVQIRSHPPALRAWLTGVLTGLLPCGWLWAFAIAAAGTGSALYGGAVMVVFWAGTVPAMLGVMTLGGSLLARLRARLPAITAIVLIVLGLGTLALRWNDAGEGQVTRPSCPMCEGRP
jgi:uncharacterized protein